MLGLPVASQVQARAIQHQRAAGALHPGHAGRGGRQIGRQQVLQPAVPTQCGHAKVGQQLQVKAGMASAILVAGERGQQGVTGIAAWLCLMQELGKCQVQCGERQGVHRAGYFQPEGTDLTRQITHASASV